ncbi:MAG: hypothetical protein WKF66_07180 [Pedobacter sp.]
MTKIKNALFLLSITCILNSCGLTKGTKNEPKAIAKGTTVNGIERKSWVTRFTIGMLEYFGRKQDGQEDKHPTEKVWPPKK